MDPAIVIALALVACLLLTAAAFCMGLEVGSAHRHGKTETYRAGTAARWLGRL